MDPLFKRHLLQEGVPEDHIIKIELDRPENMQYYKDPIAFDQHVRGFIKDDSQYYVLLDEIQLVENFEYVLNGFLYDNILADRAVKFIENLCHTKGNEGKIERKKRRHCGCHHGS